MTTTAKTLTAGGTLARMIRACAQQTEKISKGVPEGRRLYQLGPGKSTPLWLLGHLANTADFIGCHCGLGKSSGLVPEPWRKKFTPPMFGGDPITSNAADYPSWEEVLDTYKKVLAHLEAGVAALSDEDLLAAPRKPLPPPLAAMLPSLQDCVSLNVIHDSHHRGQMALLGAAPGDN